MELSIWDGISDMNEKTPPAEVANGVLHNNKSTCFYLLVLYPRRHMPSIQNGKNISIHFTEDEIPLLDEFEQYRKQNYINRSGWVKQHMKKALTENKRQLAFRWNEKPEYQSIDLLMLVELSGKN